MSNAPTGILYAMGLGLLVWLLAFAAFADDTSRPSVLTDQPKIVLQTPAQKTDAEDADPELHALRDDVTILCGGSNARVQMDGSGASLPSYPCSVAQTNLSLYRLREREGFVPGAQRFFLKAASVTRGIGATLLGWVGLS